jgi:hypothetical protein
MSEVWVVPAVCVAAIAGFGLFLYLWVGRERPVEFADEREERLTRALSQMVRCDLAGALPWVRQEIRIAPDQSDEALLKRAAYHYRREVSDRPCPLYRDRTPG